MSTLPPIEDLLSQLRSVPAKKRQEIERAARKSTGHMRWMPNPGQQTAAYLSLADILHYGGRAGGGKSHLLLGWGTNECETGIIFRRELSQTDGLEAEGKKILGSKASWNGQDHDWTWPKTGKTLKLGGMKEADSWMSHAGRERDFIGYDEAGEFLETQVASMMAWLRSISGRRTRMILASNPPRTSAGLWIVDWFAPWLDSTHERFPTEEGELLWAVYITYADGSGRTVWVDGPGEYTIDGEQYTAMSRTFIHASLEDNPFRNTPEYRAKLQSLPEPLRSQLLKGDYRAGLQDQANQCIPTDWVRQAQGRWTPEPPPDVPMCAIGVDPAAGGKDNMVLAPRHDAWFAPLVIIPGKEIPTERMGSYQAGLVVSHRRDGAIPIIDMGGGYGAALLNQLNENDIHPIAYKGATGTTRKTKDRKLGFVNTRSAAYWGFMEALDPDQPGGSQIALPESKRLLAGLCAPEFEVTARGIKLEAKSKREGGTKGVVERLGWSPDEADAVVMAWWGGARRSSHALQWLDGEHANRGQKSLHGMAPRVILAHPAAKRRAPRR